jgi:hypothetical protein
MGKVFTSEFFCVEPNGVGYPTNWVSPSEDFDVRSGDEEVPDA